MDEFETFNLFKAKGVIEMRNAPVASSIIVAVC